MNQTMHLLKPINNTSSLIPYEQLYIQSLYQGKKAIREQGQGDRKTLFALAIDLNHPQHDKTCHTTPSKPYTRPTQRLHPPKKSMM